MTKAHDEFYQEANRIKGELRDLFRNWEKRSADPLLVTHLVLVRMIALSMGLFNSADEHQKFFKDIMSEAVALHNEVCNNATTTFH